MLQGIVGFEIAVTRLEGKYKLSQNRPAIDRPRIIAALKAGGDPEAAARGERRDEHVVARVEAVDRAGEIEPVGQRLDRRVRGQRLGAWHTVLVRHGQPHRPQAE